MAKNPIMPVYYNDLRGATLTFTDEEFGAYMRLLIFQWDKGHIPGEAERRAMISATAQAHWALLSAKFLQNADGSLYNEYLEEVRENKKKHSDKQKENVAKRYQTSTNASTKPFTKKLPLEDEKEIEDTVLKNIVTPAPEKETTPAAPVIFKDETVLIVPELIALWKIIKPDYVVDNFVDFPAVRQIAQMIAAKKKMQDYTGMEAVTVVKNNFEAIVRFADTHSLYKDFQLTQISKYFNAIVSAMKSAKDTVTPGETVKAQTSLVKNNVGTAAAARELLKGKYAENKK